MVNAYNFMLPWHKKHKLPQQFKYKWDIHMPEQGLSDPWHISSCSTEFLPDICLGQLLPGDHFPKGHLDPTYLTGSDDPQAPHSLSKRACGCFVTVWPPRIRVCLLWTPLFKLPMGSLFGKCTGPCPSSLLGGWEASRYGHPPPHHHL